mgnify:FL=1
MKSLITSLFLVVSLLVTGCHGYKVHPGAYNKLDSKTYDTLLVTQGVIEEAKLNRTKYNVQANQALDNLIVGYNTAMHDYKTYHLSLIHI